MLRNRDFRRFGVCLVVLVAIFTALGAQIAPTAGALILVASAAFGAVFFLFTKARYDRIAQLTEEIDQVLHNADHLLVSSSEEGELSILESEITKMTLRIREQNDALRREKTYLADSLADVAHQLRTPLTSAGIILTLVANEPEQEERKRLLREAEALFGRTDWLLTTLLKLSRLDAGIVAFQRESVEVQALIKAALRPLLIPMELREIVPKTEIAAGVMLRCDQNWLAEALQNILKNCIESIVREGSIAITCADNPLFTELTIHDSGPGFDREELPHIFERFYRGKASGATGYGIGLALSRTIITRQGGTLAARNHPQGGALFVLRFPK